MQLWLCYVIKLNGLYDILCAMSILEVIDFAIINKYALRHLHLSMFLSYCPENPAILYERILAYWIFTYGIIRLYSSEYDVISYSYYIEAAVIAYESLMQKTIHMDKAHFVIWSSLLLGTITSYMGNKK